jgi:hypothetical protein
MRKQPMRRPTARKQPFLHPGRMTDHNLREMRRREWANCLISRIIPADPCGRWTGRTGRPGGWFECDGRPGEAPMSINVQCQCLVGEGPASTPSTGARSRSAGRGQGRAVCRYQTRQTDPRRVLPRCRGDRGRWCDSLSERAKRASGRASGRASER